jgi:hypothetical protein
MALISLGESKWRMVRRVLKKKSFSYPDCRGQTRQDQTHFEWLVRHGFFSPVGDGRYEVTEKGRAVADLGFYEV